MSLPVRLFEFVLGSLLALTDVDNWEEHGAVTPEEAAEYFDEWVYNLLDMGCKVDRPFIAGVLTSNLSTTNVAYEPLPWTDGASNSPEHFQRTGQQIDILQDGWYSISCFTVFAGNATGFRRIKLQDEVGISYIEQATNLGTSMVTVSLVKPAIKLDAGAELVFYAYQNSGGNLDVVANNTTFGPTSFLIERLAHYDS